MSMAGDLLDRLSQLDSCAVSDALDSAGIMGVATGLTQLSSRRRIVGRAITVKLGASGGDHSKRHLGTAAVEAAGRHSVIVVDHDGRTDVAGWGGILTLAASRRGAVGVVIDGACRDIDEARDLDFPIYGRVSVPRTARGHVVERGWNMPVQISGVEVSPGDFVIADGSGVVFMPAVRAPELTAMAELVARKEAAMADAVRAGMPVSHVMAGDYENMLKLLRP